MYRRVKILFSQMRVQPLGSMRHFLDTLFPLCLGGGFFVCVYVLQSNPLATFWQLTAVLNNNLVVWIPRLCVGVSIVGVGASCIQWLLDRDADSD